MRAELVVQVPHVRPDRVHRHIKLAGDLRRGKAGLQEAQDAGLGLAERFGQLLRLGQLLWWARGRRRRRPPAYAGASAAEVEATARKGVLHVSVRDDGRGGADFGRGSGLAGLKDRIEALGGRISLHSPPGAGTTLQIALPLSGPTRPAWEG